MNYRLNKYLALCALGSRRKVEKLIIDGRISVNGQTVKDFATKISAETDRVDLDGKSISPIKKFQYLILNKPKGYVTTMSDEKNRPTVMDLIPEKYRREGIFPVGRLDKNSEGLLLFTNDGDLASKLNSPKYNITKEYIVEINTPLNDEDKIKIEKGIFIHQLKIKTRPAKISFIDNSKSLVKIILKEGKKRQIRFTLQNFGYKVKKLTRISYGPLNIIGLNKGSYRPLKGKEISLLLSLVKNNK